MPSGLGLLIVLGAGAAAAPPTPAALEACASAYTETERVLWGTTPSTWRDICAEGDPPDVIRQKGGVMFLASCRKRFERHIQARLVSVARVRLRCSEGMPGARALARELNAQAAPDPVTAAGFSRPPGTSSAPILYRLVRTLGASVDGVAFENIRFVRPDGRYRSTSLGDQIVMSETTPPDCYIMIQSMKAARAQAGGMSVPERLYDSGCTGTLKTVELVWGGHPRPRTAYTQADLDGLFDLILDVFQKGY